MKLGKINQLEVKREADISYILTDGFEEIFLHKKEAEKPYESGEIIDVFLYDDNQGRITASTRPPSLTVGEVRLLEVVEVKEKYGVWLNYGMVKDLLLSKDDLPKNLSLWPLPKDKLYVTMKVTGNRLFAQVLSRYELKNSLEPQEDLPEKEVVTAYLQFFIDAGIVLYTAEGHEIFVHKNNYREKYRLGQELNVKIIAKNDQGNYSGSMIEQKELMINKDADIIYEYLEAHGGFMTLTDKSSPEIIQGVFHMSKAAYKRALGHLKAQGKVELNPDNTKIKKVN
jgi:predicted RNA-binding protein (virulence factor B family)